MTCPAWRCHRARAGGSAAHSDGKATRMPENQAQAPVPPARFAASVLGPGGVLAVGVLFALVLPLVASRWAPLRAVDTGIVDALNPAVSAWPRAVQVGSSTTRTGRA